MTYLEKRLKEIDDIGALNVNGRREKFTRQLIEQGFHDGDTFDLYIHLSELILPRLKRFSELRCDYPCNLKEDEWNSILNKMIKAFEFLTMDKFEYNDEDENTITEGLKLFAEHFRNLWW